MFKKKQTKEEIDMEEFMPDVGMEDHKPPKKKLPGWVIIPILAVVVVVFVVISKVFGAETQTTTQFATVKVERGEVKEEYTTSGTVNSEKTKVFYSPVNAPVKDCNAKVGTAVKAGDTLITYDTTTLEQDNKQTELNALSTKYTNQDAVEQANRSAASAAAAESQTASQINSLNQKIQDKQAEINSLSSAAASAQGEASANAAVAAELEKQMQDNLDQQSKQKVIIENADREREEADITDEKKQELINEANQANVTLKSLEDTYRKLENKLSAVGSTDSSGTAEALAAANQELESLKSSLSEVQNSSQTSVDTGTTAAQKKGMQVSEDLAELSQLSTEELLAKGKEGIKAEFDGVISDVQVGQGTSAVQGGALFTLVSNKDVAVELEVSANDFEKLVEGVSAEVKIGQKTYKGTLTSIDKIALTNAKGNPVIGADIHIDNPDDDIYIGVSAKVNMTVAEKKDTLYLPNEVVNTSADGDFVYVIKNGVVVKQEVELGVTSDSNAEIVSGLKEGDQVISDVSGDVEEGMLATSISSEE
ncbi:MAG: efflux RND transporter periplasmic adaptor subunit [Lachnospiraceae bacterium]